MTRKHQLMRSEQHWSHGYQGYEDWARYDQFLAAQLAYFIDRLHSTDDPLQDGSLLDHTIVLYGCSTSRTHQAVNYPLILAGAKSMGFRHGQHRRFDESKHRSSDLYSDDPSTAGPGSRPFCRQFGIVVGTVDLIDRPMH